MCPNRCLRTISEHLKTFFGSLPVFDGFFLCHPPTFFPLLVPLLPGSAMVIKVRSGVFYFFPIPHPIDSSLFLLVGVLARSTPFFLIQKSPSPGILCPFFFRPSRVATEASFELQRPAPAVQILSCPPEALSSFFFAFLIRLLLLHPRLP